MNSQVDTLTRKNEQLCKELTEIDKMAEQLEKEKEQTLEAAEEELEKVTVGVLKIHILLNALFS